MARVVVERRDHERNRLHECVCGNCGSTIEFDEVMDRQSDPAGRDWLRGFYKCPVCAVHIGAATVELCPSSADKREAAAYASSLAAERRRGE